MQSMQSIQKMEVGYLVYLKVNGIIIDSIESINVKYNYEDTVFSDTEMNCFNDWIELPSAKQIIDNIKLYTTNKFPILNIIQKNLSTLNTIDKSNIHITIDTVIQLLEINESKPYIEDMQIDIKLIGYKVFTTPYNL